MLKDLIVFADDRADADERLRLAAALARRHDAHLTGLHVFRPFSIPPTLDGYVVDELIEAEEERSLQDAAAAERRFRAAAGDLRHEWRVERASAPGEVARHVHAADLAIVGQASTEAESLVLPEEVTLLSGRPVLVVPSVGRYEAVASNPLIAWKRSRESARAVHDALPLLVAAKRATILVIDAEADEGGSTEGDDLARNLARHGVAATVSRTVSAGTPLGELILSAAADAAADLLVMGCYGHSRVREMVLGGVTREILRSMTLPVLMAH